MKLSLVLQAIDRWSAPISKATASARGLANNGLDPVARSATRVDRALDRMVIGGNGRLDRLARRIRDTAGPLGMKALEKSAYGAGYAVGFTIRQVGKLAMTAARFTIAGAGLLGGMAGGMFTRGVIATASSFEQFQVVLENTEGSAAKAKQAMAWVQRFARTTPYEVSEVMQAFVALKAYGIDPMNGSLTSLGNAAAGMGKPLMQAIEMLADAQTGEFERLKEFGIRAKKQGDQVTFTYMRAGKEITRTARASGAEMQRAITGIFDERFAGMMDRQSRTLAGMWSNLKDQVAGFQLDIANAGFFDVVKGELQSVLDWLNVKAADGSLARWAKKISDELSNMVRHAKEFYQNTDWTAVRTTLATLAGAAWNFARALAWALDKASRLWALLQRLPTPGGFTLGQRFQLDQMANNPGSGSAAPRRPPAPAPPRGRGPLLPGATPAARNWPRPVRQAPVWPRAVPGSRQTSAIDGRVKVDVTLKGDGARGARVDRVASSDRRVPVTVATGRAMAGEA